ncbi:hypothetical protein GCM10010909_01990 [Acidocella aquatica]|uniref:DUF2501 domain-containing protein n=1 Tax=Acidocella aquatica TaxID=1922313 RepID=A0ABQ6A3R8_9PROT|nr:DUF2501 domain-containing protein [Acidocella aquatica]GLR65521.1 hypothetical protein GCM10010909_01990 [Acidocella aquatica]
MRKGKISFAAGLLLAAGIFAAPQARAQISGMLQGAMGGGQNEPATPGLGGMGGMGSMGGAGMGGMGMPSLGAAPPANIAGILQYCIQNNYLGGGASQSSASSVQQSLLSKYTGSSSDPSSNSGFTSGSNGILDTGNGNSMPLGGSGLKAQLTQKICDQILQRAQSML